jgi:hypothetical protein
MMHDPISWSPSLDLAWSASVAALSGLASPSDVDCPDKLINIDDDAHLGTEPVAGFWNLLSQNPNKTEGSVRFLRRASKVFGRSSRSRSGNIQKLRFLLSLDLVPHPAGR